MRSRPTAGAVYVFQRSGSAWIEQAKLVPADLLASDRFGSAVEVDATLPGDVRIIGSAVLHDIEPDLDNAGAVWVYHGDGPAWSGEELLAPAPGAGDKFGQSVAIAGDVAVVGIYLDDDFGQNSGSVAVYRYDGASWNTSVIDELTASDGSPDDQLGRAVAISEDGYWIIAGAALSDGAGSGSGSAYLYEWVDDSFWSEVARLEASDANPNDEFGNAVSIATIVDSPMSAHVLVGASKDDDPDEGNNAGSAYLFTSAVDECSDCNDNLIPDINEIIENPDLDCNENSILDVCEIYVDTPADGGPFFCTVDCDPDCNENGIPDACDIMDGISPDQNDNGVPDECEDCNNNGVPDEIDILEGAVDCNDNLILDSCELTDGLAEDCNNNGTIDECDLDPTDPDGDGHVSNDCDGDGAPDECSDCNGNGIADSCDIDPTDPDGDGNVSFDFDGDGVPDECQDCNENSVPDYFELNLFPELDCNDNGVIDDCEIAADSPAPGGPYYCTDGCNPDCNDNGVPDDCDIASLTSTDENGNGVPDECEDCNENGVPDSFDIGSTSDDCNGNGVPDECEIHFSSQAPGGPFFCVSGCEPDCNLNGVPDVCDILGSSDDCDENGVPDECEADCNGNGVNDTCDIADGTAFDVNGNGVPDSCDPDCDDNGLPDFAEILFGVQEDCNGNEIPDNCDVDPSDPDGNGSVSADVDADGVPDECGAGSADLNGDLVVDFSDLLIVLGNWGACAAPCPPDFDDDGDVDFQDLLVVLSQWS